MESKPLKRVTVSVPLDVVEQLDFVARKMRCSRSALLSYLLPQILEPLSRIVSVLPESGSVDEVDARRARGESGRVLGEELAKLLEGGSQEDLFRV